MGEDFELIEHTADIGIRAYGKSLPEAFSNAARAMFSIITNLHLIRNKLHRDVEVAAPDREILLVEWLNELLYLFDTEQLLFKKFEIINMTDTEIKTRCYGERVNKSRHGLKRGIKSVTYHMLKVENHNQYRVQVLFDI